jgi:hypothetical protein
MQGAAACCMPFMQNALNYVRQVQGDCADSVENFGAGSSTQGAEMQSAAQAPSNSPQCHTRLVNKRLPVVLPQQVLSTPAIPSSATLGHTLLHDPIPRVRQAAAVTISTLLEGPAQRAYLGVAECAEVERQPVRCGCLAGQVALAAMALAAAHSAPFRQPCCCSAMSRRPGLRRCAQAQNPFGGWEGPWCGCL